MLKEFKAFLLRGNVIELAVGIIIGAAFSNIVTSLIQDVITPLLLKPALDAARLNKLEELTLMGTVRYGSFLAAILNFLIMSFILFMIIKAVNLAIKKRNETQAEPQPPPAPPADIQLLTEIRDLLRKNT